MERYQVMENRFGSNDAIERDASIATAHADALMGRSLTSVAEIIRLKQLIPRAHAANTAVSEQNQNVIRTAKTTTRYAL
jgi:hypothetical protein